MRRTNRSKIIAMKKAVGLYQEEQSPDRSVMQRSPLRLDPIAELDRKIAMGWGDTPQVKLPADWATRRGPGKGWQE